MKKDNTGEQVSLIVNRDTNLDCAAAPASQGAKKSEMMTSDRITADKQAPQASQRQMEQGQRKDETARGGGFRIGQCSFQPGDRVKAEVDDMGRVTTLKYLAAASFLAPFARAERRYRRVGNPQAGKAWTTGYDRSGRLRGPPESAWGVQVIGSRIPAPRPVKDLKGKRVGTLEDLIMDTATGGSSMPSSRWRALRGYTPCRGPRSRSETNKEPW